MSLALAPALNYTHLEAHRSRWELSLVCDRPWPEPRLVGKLYLCCSLSLLAGSEILMVLGSVELLFSAVWVNMTSGRPHDFIK